MGTEVPSEWTRHLLSRMVAVEKLTPVKAAALAVGVGDGLGGIPCCFARSLKAYLGLLLKDADDLIVIFGAA